ncbi:MAG: phosphoglycerate kinase [Oscillospiraceae bacterium]|jgi:3-phosphoglycerate kinase|nr:phosphoglycerate kinase [Oscillospiraceae bacterium]
MNKMTIEDISVAGKKVLVRCDFNVPLDEKRRITDDTRITAALPTIEYLLEKGAKLVLCSHLGRPKGKIDPKYSLAPVASRLSQLLGKTVLLAPDVIGDGAKELCANLKDGEAVLLENLRFHAEEEKNDPAFAKELASLAEVYVNDAFGTAHRAHASTEGVTHYLHPSVAGFLIKKELDVMGKALENPEHPFVAILGGAKVSDKIGVISNLLGKVDVLLIGGGMAYTFQKALGGKIGKSLLEEDKIDLARELMEKAAHNGVRLVLPIDNEAANEFSNDAMHITVHSHDIPDGFEGMDIGPKTRVIFAAEVSRAKTVVWNGPMGVFEFENFSTGTREIAKAMAECPGVTIIGGGDSAAAVEQMGFANKITHISTGGGASLEFLEGIELPGVAALTDKA